MDTFRGKDNVEIKAFFEKRLQIAYRSSSLILLSIKKQRRLPPKFNTWYADHVSGKLKKGVDPGDVKVSVKMSNLKPLHARWIVDMPTYLKQQK